MHDPRILSRTTSVCPVCLNVLPAQRVAHADGIYLHKTCPQHGEFCTLIWEGDASSYLAWDASSRAVDHPIAFTEERAGCPYDCGLCPQHLRHACCVLLEITARCNLRCPVCFASAGDHDTQDPSLETIAGWYDRLMQSGGPYNIQLSGGEPTLREDLCEIIALGRQKGFSFFQLNTNGLRLAADAGYARALARAGLNCVFLQFDGLDEKATVALRGEALLQTKLRAVERCAQAGLGVVLVPTIVPGINDDQLGDILQFALERLPSVRGVHFQPVSYFGRCALPPPQKRLTLPAMLRRIERQTGGRMRAQDFRGGGAENAYCSFHANYMLQPDGALRALRDSAGDGCCRATSEKSRTFVARQWSAPARPANDTAAARGSDCADAPATAGPCQCNGAPATAGALYNADALDAFLDRLQNYTLAVSGMLFQDAYTLDTDRLKRCYICEVSPDGRMVPFCAYNLTSNDGVSLYRT